MQGRPLETGRMVGKYRLVRPLAAGGMGYVWVAKHIELDTEAAVKFQRHARSSTTALHQFRTEAQILARLRHPNIVQILDFGVDDEHPYLAMELLDGEDLRSTLARSSVSLTEAFAIAVQIAKALGHAHARGVIHRDVKPSNIFLASVGSDRIAKMLDLGIAQQSSATHQKVRAGSPAYMSPAPCANVT